MSDLQNARQQIDIIDREMAELFVRRMQAVKDVSDYKKEHGLPVFDASREDAVIEKNCQYINDDEIRPFYVEFLRDTMKASRHYQRKRLQGMNVAFSGIEGAFASIAAGKLFPYANRVPYPDFKSAYKSVEDGECDVAVLPIENSTAGEVGQVMDIMFFGGLYVTGIFDLSVHHNLLGTPDSKISKISKVISHPQALSQCKAYIEEHDFDEIQAENTATAARSVAEGKDPSVAAIASVETAELYGLKVLKKNINETTINTTRFVVLSRSAVTEDNNGRHCMLMFTVRNEAGSLAQAINIIGKHGYNMRCLRSRPMKELLWQYYFYVEIEGNLESNSGRSMLEELSSCCDKLKVLGTFKYPNES